MKPKNIEAEQSFLGLLLGNNNNINKINNIINEKHFYMPIHKKIYKTIKSLIEKKMIADPISLQNYFSRDSLFINKDINSYKYLMDLVEKSYFAKDIRTLSKNIY